jgi:hypothetical protein
MAIYHLSVKPISRSAGRSATAAAAYRAGELGAPIVDERTGDVHDYTRKRGVLSADIVLPDGAPSWAQDRPRLWNAAELAEKRKDACVAREYEVALPSELTPNERRLLALDFAKDMANREGCAVDVCIHEPGRGGDSRNHHAHILRTTRRVDAEGMGAKLDTEKAGRNRTADLEAVRARWAQLTNERLAEAGSPARVDHRSLVDQGMDRAPTKHLGPAATGFERRTGQPSENRIRQEEVMERLMAAKQAGELERQARQVDGLILDLSGDIAAAKLLRDRQQAQEITRQAEADRKRKEDQERQAHEAARQKIEAMSTAEFRASINQLRPAPLAELVSRDPAVIDADQAARLLAQKFHKLQGADVAARQAAQAWRAENPVRAKMHDAGLVVAKPLAEHESAGAAARQEADRVQPLWEAAQQKAKDTRQAVGLQIDAELAPMRKRVELLEGLLQEKIAREAQEAQQRKASMQERIDAGRAFEGLAARRAARSPGFEDGNAAWSQATPEALRQLIDAYNSHSAAERAMLLTAFTRDPERAKKLAELTQQRDQALQQRGLTADEPSRDTKHRDRDRGPSR